MHLTSSPVDWYAARAAGVVAYVLLTVVVSVGLAMSARLQFERWPRFALEEVHRAGGILVGVFVAIHVMTIAVDSYLRFSLTAILVPFTAAYRPFWVGLGVVAAELLVALAVTNRLRDRIGYRRWRLFHYANFAVWTAATLHGLASGTDRGAAWLLALEAAAVAAVACLTARRLGLAWGRAASAGAAGAGGALVLALVAFPFHPRPWNATDFHDRLVGVVSRDAGPTRELVSLTARGEGEQRVLLRADLLVEPQGLLATSFELEFLPSGLRCAGRVTRIAPLGFDGTCRTREGSTRHVRAQWQESGGALAEGTLDART